MQSDNVRQNLVLFNLKLKGLHSGTIGFATKGKFNGINIKEIQISW